MTLPTYITTLGRADDQVTLRQVPHAILVVQDHEYDLHRAKYPGQSILSLPPSIRTLGATRRHMLEVVAPEVGGKIVLLDDDLTFLFRPKAGDWHLKLATGEDMMILWLRVGLALDKYAHVGVSGREGNNRFGDEPEESTRYMRVLCYNTSLFPPGVEVGRVDGMSDFDLNLQLLRAGRKSLVFTRWAQGHRGTQQPGGCSGQRSQESHTREAEFLAAAHPGLVKLRQKSNKTGGDFGTRTEVTVSWKKALPS